MIETRRAGAAELTQLVEIYGPTHDADWMLPGVPHADLAPSGSSFFPAYYAAATNRLIFAFKLFLLKTGNDLILIDTGIGNFKPRPNPSQHMINTPVLDWLETIGTVPERVTHVVHTHLHGDHVGWNTRLVDGRWEPTFPNATYALPSDDWHAYKARFDAGERDIFGGSLGDSVVPIVEAGLARFIAPGDCIADCLTALASPGHTPGHVHYALRDAGEEFLFVGDVIHSPVQVGHPELNCRWCEAPDRARQSRWEILAHAAAHDATVFPAHALSLDGWRIRESGAGFSVQLSP
jgi:glyoxylase-like metal-dependent hydrolase (beta-lactamase superfamily II)